MKAIKRTIHQDLRKQYDIGLEKNSLVAVFENFLYLVEIQEMNSVKALMFLFWLLVVQIRQKNR